MKSDIPQTSGLNHEGENLSGYSVGYYYELNNGAFITRAGLAIYVPETEGEVNLSATFIGIKDNKTNRNITVSFTKLAATQTVGDVKCNVYLSNLGDLAIYNMLETVTITIGEKSGTYNVIEYINNMDALVETHSNRLSELNTLISPLKSKKSTLEARIKTLKDNASRTEDDELELQEKETELKAVEAELNPLLAEQLPLTTEVYSVEVASAL